MKRTKLINLERMRKSIDSFRLKPIAMGVAAVSMLVSCSSGTPTEGEIFQSLNDCKQKYPQLSGQCDKAYQDALLVAKDSSPKYSSLSECAKEYGRDQCVSQRNPSGGNWFMPAMAGFLFAQMVDRNRYYSAPLFTSYSSSSPYYYRWSTVDGHSYGNYRSGRVKVNRQTFQPKPKVTKTVSRGGFGSKVAAKSKWGGSKSRSRSSWGG